MTPSVSNILAKLISHQDILINYDLGPVTPQASRPLFYKTIMDKDKDTSESEGMGQLSQAPETSLHTHALPLNDTNLEQLSESFPYDAAVGQETSSDNGPYDPISNLETPGIDRSDITRLMEDHVLRTTGPWTVVPGGELIVVFESVKLVITNDSENTMLQVETHPDY